MQLNGNVHGFEIGNIKRENKIKFLLCTTILPDGAIYLLIYYTLTLHHLHSRLLEDDIQLVAIFFAKY